MRHDPDPIDHALTRAVVYQALSLAFQTPTADRLNRLGARNGFGVLVGALLTLNESADSKSLARSAARLASLSVPRVPALTDSYWRLFGHTTRGLVCGCETEYGPDNGFHQPQQLADISGFYLAFGLRPLAAAEVRGDHIACECEFMDFLSRKEARLLDSDALDEPSAATLDVTQQGARLFLRDHLGRFGRAFSTRVAAEDGDGYFGAFAGVLFALIEAECARVGIQAGPEDLIVRPDDIDDTPMACGSADELIQIQRRP